MDQQNDMKPVKDSVAKRPAPPMSGIRTTAYKDIDTLISLRTVNLTPHSVNLHTKAKKYLVESAVKSAMKDKAYLFLDNECYRYDRIKKGITPIVQGKGLDCRLADFYLIDLDKDGDLDIIYYSELDQYINWDTNLLLLFQNIGNDNFNQLKIPGYLYNVVFSDTKQGIILFKTVEKPCCDYFNYNFYETAFDTRTWKINTKHVLEIHQSKVTKDYSHGL